MKVTVSFLVGLLLYAAQGGWQANPQIVRETAAKQPAFNYEEARVPPYTLPELFPGAGATVTTPDGWRERRGEILELFRANVYGRSPGRPAG